MKLNTDHKLPFVFGLLGSSQKLLYVLSDLLRLTDDILCARQGGIFLTLLLWLHRFRGWKRAARNAKEKKRLSLITAICNEIHKDIF